MAHDVIRRHRLPLTWLVRGAVLVLLPLASCTHTQQTADSAAANAQAQTTPTLSASDSTFIDQAARAGLAEVQAGQLAAHQSPRPAVHQFAEMMVHDHTEINDQLTALARQKQVTPPTAPADDQVAEIQRLQTLHGRVFDRTYLSDQVAGHQQALNLFQTEAQQGTDPDVKAFAARYVPTIQDHLQEAERLGGHAPTS